MASTDVDDYATELHNPEITEPQGSGNVPERNYKTIAALALRRGEIGREDMGEFVANRGCPASRPHRAISPRRSATSRTPAPG